MDQVTGPSSLYSWARGWINSSAHSTGMIGYSQVNQVYTCIYICIYVIYTGVIGIADRDAIAGILTEKKYYYNIAVLNKLH